MKYAAFSVSTPIRSIGRHSSRRSRGGALGFAMALLVLCSAATVAPAAPDPVDIGSRLQLFLDGRRIDRMTTAVLRLHSPEGREVVFRFDAPWEGVESGYVTLLKDGDRYRLYYRGGGELTEEVTCVAESDDAIHWTRPTLGLFEYKGSKENNIIWKGREKAYWESHNFTPFLDANPAARPEERYKAVALGRYPDDAGETRKMLVAFVSPDGIRWKRLQEDPIIRGGSFDSQNLAFWDAPHGEYACYSRIGRNGYRSVQRNLSKDFVHWSEGVPLDFGPQPLEQFYTNAIQPYPRNPSIYIGAPMRFVPHRKTVGDPPRNVEGVSDAVLISSHDGLHFDRTFPEGWIRPGLDPRDWGLPHSNNTPAWGMLPSGDSEISVYWSVIHDGVPELQRGAIRVDGFASLHMPPGKTAAAGKESPLPPHGGAGELVTRPLAFRGDGLVLNYSTSAVGSVRVEIQDAAGRPLPGYSLDECEEIFGDEIARRVSWKAGRDVGTLAGTPVRLRFVLVDADVYSFQFVPKKDPSPK